MAASPAVPSCTQPSSAPPPFPLFSARRSMAAVPTAGAVHPDVVSGDDRRKGKSEVESETTQEKEENVGGEEEGATEVEVEPKTGVSFPVRMDDGKQLAAVGVRKKGILGLSVKIYTFGIYADNAKLQETLRSKFGTAPTKPTKELYETVIDSDIAMSARLVIVFGGLTMSMVRKNLDEGLGASLKKLTAGSGQKNDELLNKSLESASDGIKLSTGSVIEISRLPGWVFQTKVKGEVLSKVKSDLLCRAFFHMYLGDEALDKEAKERVGRTLLSLF